MTRTEHGQETPPHCCCVRHRASFSQFIGMVFEFPENPLIVACMDWMHYCKVTIRSDANKRELVVDFIQLMDAVSAWEIQVNSIIMNNSSIVSFKIN